MNSPSNYCINRYIYICIYLVSKYVSIHIYIYVYIYDSDGKESACKVGDPGSIPGWKYPREKGMASHVSILAWRNSWTEEPSGLQSMGSQRVGHDRETQFPFSLHSEYMNIYTYINILYIHTHICIM